MRQIRQFVTDFRAEVHRRAEKLRIETWAEQEILREHGPSDLTQKQWELALAWADLLDALVGYSPESTRR